MKKIATVLTLTLLSLFSCRGYDNVTFDTLQAILEADGMVQLVDVRTPEEFAAGHIAGAVNIDWRSESFLDNAVALLDPDRVVIVYCRAGNRSAEASEKLEEQGFEVYNLIGGIESWVEGGAPVTTYEVERFFTEGGAPVEITLIKHGSLAIRYNGISIQVDPVTKHGKTTDYAADFPKADVILLTHEHGDHLDKNAIEVLKKESTVLVSNKRCAELLGWGTALSNGESADLAEDIKVEAVPAYNTTDGHTQFHPKGRDNGYVLNIDGLRIYIAGDTEDIPEMAELKDIDVAFLPVNQPYTMTVEQCIRAARLFSPKVLIPYHFGNTDLSELPSRLSGIKVLLRQMQ